MTSVDPTGNTRSSDPLEEKKSVSKNGAVLDIPKGENDSPLRKDSEYDTCASNSQAIFVGAVKIQSIDDRNAQNLHELLSYNAEMLPYISAWEKGECKDLQERLQYLVCLKRRVISKVSDPEIWVNSFLLQPTIQDFIVAISNIELKHPQTIMSTLQEVISKKDITFIDPKKFIEIERISSWLYGHQIVSVQYNISENITSFSSLIAFLNKLLEEQRVSDKKRSSVNLANLVSEGIYYLRFHFKNTYDDVLINILVRPFIRDSFNDVVTLKAISLSDLEFLKSSFSSQRANFESYLKKGSLIIQSYLLLLALSTCNDIEEQSKIFIKQIHQMLKDLEIPIENDILKSLKKYFNDSSLENLRGSLNHLLIKPCQGKLKKSAYKVDSEREEGSADKTRLKKIDEQFNKLSYYEDDFAILNENPEAHSLLEQLELCMYYPKKLKPRDALCIRPETLELSLNMKSISRLNQLPHLILHKMMSYDCLCRTDLVSMIKLKVSDQTLQSDESDCDEFVDSEDECDTKLLRDDLNSGIHPVDCLLAILICSDDFLRQDLLSRLAKCQLAIPFILPEPFSNKLSIPLWGMRSIIKEWKSIGGNNEIMEHTCSVVQYPMPIISFIRIGVSHRNGPSKSKILNDVISDAHHDYFFHRDCRGGQYKTILGKGLVDICWYFPSGNPADIFPDAIAFLNLHGDAREYSRQINSLSKISSMCIVLLTESDPEIDSQLMAYLSEIHSNPGGIVVLNCAEKQPKIWKKSLPKSHVINLTSKTASEIKDAIRARIKAKVEKMKDCKCIENVCSLTKSTIEIDEDSQTYQIGLYHANKIKEMIATPKDSEPTLKDTLIPLQGDNLWKAWAIKDKELHRQTNKGAESSHDYTTKMLLEKSNLRRKQLAKVKSLSPVMTDFIKSLVQLGRSSLRNYYLQILKLEMNSLSREDISQKQCEYQDTRKELSILQAHSSSQKSGKKIEITKLQNRLKCLQEDIIGCSLGLEHLLRELGQVYEAALEGKKNSENINLHQDLDYYISQLPKAAGELLVEGYPLELMDGDAAHVPLEWVKAVIKEAVILLDDPKVFVMSVLGLQSTGKSTMLNTSFGLQFNVSAGRCTRGAFIQLLELDEDLKSRTKCSYVLIVDTEGLRAPELDPQKTQKHDNELATFVIGLANMTLINIYGEVPGDMDDILQTSVHAFLRMTQVRYYPSCQFVHQNAGVNIKGEVGRAKFTEKLNNFTTDAAREESCEGRFQTFNDVIKFNDQTDVHYFPGLWKGDPPMAPVNQGYSQTAQNLKHQLVQILLERAGVGVPVSAEDTIGDLCLSSFRVKIQDLWQTLLKEKFVFSFKNTLEITAYKSLETAFSTWDWTLQSAMLDWEQKAENEISTEPLNTVAYKVLQKLQELQIHVSEKLAPLKEDMEGFFNGKQSEILVQWKKRFEIRLETLATDLRIRAEEHCNNLLKSRQAISEFEAAQEKNTRLIYIKVQQHIEIVKQDQEKLQESLEKRELKPAQLKKLLSRDLFSSENLASFEELQILSQDQVKLISEIKCNNEGQLTETTLKEILENDIILTLPDIKKILKKSQLTEEELQIKFDDIWRELMKELPRFKSTTQISVSYEIERALTMFVERKGYHGQLIAKFNSREINQFGSCLQLNPVRDIHYVVKSTVMSQINRVKLVFGAQDVYEMQAIEITAAVFNEASKYIEDVTKTNTDFKAAFVNQLLRLVNETITNLERDKTCKIKFTPNYLLDMCIIICGYAVSKFEKMAKLFKEQNDPRLHLKKKLKKPLFITYKNQYQQTLIEEAITDTLCVVFEEPIKFQVKKALPAKIVSKMKAAEYYLANKMALKVKILTDLHKGNEFKKIMVYVEHVKDCLKEKIQEYTEIYSDGAGPDSGSVNTRLQITAIEEVDRLIQVVNNVVSEVNKVDAHEWLSMFCNNSNLRTELGVILKAEDLLIGYDSLQELNLDSFKRSIKDGLEQLKIKSRAVFHNTKCKDMMSWNGKSPYQLLKSLVGCTEQCPFCGEQCDLLEHDRNEDHRTEVHRISCLAGWRSLSTNEMEISVCPSLINSDLKFLAPNGGYHPYKDYKAIHKNWSITPDMTSQHCSYWKWFVGEHKKKLENHFNAKGNEIPDWATIQWNTIKGNLASAYNIEFQD